MRHILEFEIRYLLKRPATWIYFSILFIIALLFECTDVIQLGGGVGKIAKNSPYVLAQATGVLTLIGCIITTSLAGAAVLRDVELGVHALFYTKPITKAQYLFGRFIGAYLIMVMVYAAVPLGLFIGSFMPNIEADKLGPTIIAAYLRPFIFFILPNIFVVSSIFFTVGTISRSMFAVYVQGIVLLVVYGISGTLTRGLDNTHISSAIDVFGLRSFGLETRYWTVFEKNTMMLPLGEYLLVNRIIWIVAGFVILGICYRLFRFEYSAAQRRGAVSDRNSDVITTAPVRAAHLPSVHQDFGSAYAWRSLLQLSVTYIRSMTRDILFLALAVIGMINTLFAVYSADSLFDTKVYPVTYLMLETLGSFSFFVLLISTFYGGELMWRERRFRAHQIVDALPVPTWSVFVAKIIALIFSQMLVIAALNFAAIIMQLAKGYAHIELPLYLHEYFYDSLVSVSLMSLFTLSVHSIVNNKYVGHFVAVILFVLTLTLPSMKIEHMLFQFMNTASGVYSDMNAYGPYTFKHFVASAYWLMFFVVSAWVAYLFSVRGSEETFGKRLQLARARMKGKSMVFGSISLLAFVGLGGITYYNTNILNHYVSSTDTRHESALFEQRYRSMLSKAQPHIAATSLQVDLEPEYLRYTASGEYVLVNNQEQAIDTVMVSLNDDKIYDQLRFDRGHRLVRDDKETGVQLYVLEPALAAHDSCRMNFHMICESKGFRNSGTPTDIAYNGTFLHSDVFPQIGYEANAELSDEDDRRKEGLGPRERMPSIDDPKAHMRNYISANTDWMRFDISISTAPDQIAIAPGYLQREWSENGRRHFRYHMDAPILGFYSLLSARYEIHRDSIDGVQLEIYYHKGHEYNLDRMMSSMKKSLQYYSKNFAPYQFRQLRILEFPRYAQFAQSFPNTVPYSESIGFIARVKGEEDIDYPFYVTAHEVAHQWWGHQVVGASVQGATMLSESFAEYSSLMVMKHEYGEATMKKFLKFALNSYLRGRSSERSKEQPLYLNENQQYLHYNKGSLVLYALADYIGEDSLNAALARFCRSYRFCAPPYPTTKDFLKELHAVVPDSLQYLIRDNFETITLYDNRVKQAACTPTADGKYDVELVVESRKLQADSLGKEHELSLNDYIDIGVFDAKEDPRTKLGTCLAMKRVKLNSTESRFHMIVAVKPAKAGIDPYNKLIDRDAEDNVMSVEQK